MRVMTFNIQHALDYKNQVIDIDLFSDFIRSCSVDFCGLNEVRSQGNWEGYTDQTGAFSEALGMQGYFAKAIDVVGTNPYGNAFLSKLFFENTKTVPVPDSTDRSEDVHYESRCAAVTEILCNDRRILFIVCHMGLAKSEAKNAVELICRILDESDLPAIVMGDFNHTKDSGVLDPLFDRLQDSDEKAKEKGKYTFPSYDPREKIDYILYRGLECKSSVVVEEIVSDHYPIIAEFE